ncbi:MAG: hypothetical protein WCP20_16405 [Desulfuromonadales bacterium]
MKQQQKNISIRQPHNKLCTSCRRTCKQMANAVVARCPRYYPIFRKQTKPGNTWKQMELGL